MKHWSDLVGFNLLWQLWTKLLLKAVSNLSIKTPVSACKMCKYSYWLWHNCLNAAPPAGVSPSRGQSILALARNLVLHGAETNAVGLVLLYVIVPGQFASCFDAYGNVIVDYWHLEWKMALLLSSQVMQDQENSWCTFMCMSHLVEKKIMGYQRLESHINSNQRIYLYSSI